MSCQLTYYILWCGCGKTLPVVVRGASGSPHVGLRHARSGRHYLQWSGALVVLGQVVPPFLGCSGIVQNVEQQPENHAGIGMAILDYGRHRRSWVVSVLRTCGSILLA